VFGTIVKKKLQVPDKGVDDIVLKQPINGLLARMNWKNVMCNTGSIYSGHQDAEGVLLIKYVVTVRGRRSQSYNTKVPIEREKGKCVK
jgi:hypothetical protein